jgi:hypothetical protein
MYAAHLPQGHQQKMMVPETDDFRQSGAIAIGGLNVADFAHGGQRTFRLNNQSNELHHAAAGFRDPRLPHEARGGLQPV